MRSSAYWRLEQDGEAVGAGQEFHRAFPGAGGANAGGGGGHAKALSRITYRALNAHANRLAHGLRRQGVVAGDVVAVLGERSIDFLAAMLAIWKAGAVYMPLDPRWPQVRRRQVLAESRTGWLLVDASHLADGEETLSRKGWQGHLLPLAGIIGERRTAGDPRCVARAG